MTIVHQTSRRSFLQSTVALSLAGLEVGVRASSFSKAQVVVIGGGFGGATAAKYIRVLSNQKINVVLIEPNESFISSPMSNLVIGGQKEISAITIPYAGLTKNHGVTLIRDFVQSIDWLKKNVTLGSGKTLSYDKLVVSLGIDLQMNQIEGYAAAYRAEQVLHAWTGGAEVAKLRQQLMAMPDGGTFAITIPQAPYRCPPAPYERASLVAAYFKTSKPKAKILILDANADVTSQPSQFHKVWKQQYEDIVEYRPEHRVIGIDGKTGTIQFEVQDDVHADLMNALPPMQAGLIAVQSGLANAANMRWCGVNFQTFESTVASDVFVVGDSIQIASLMPKSAHMANSQAKVAAAAIVAQLSGAEVNPNPMLVNTCYSFMNATDAVHVSSVHEYVSTGRTFKIAPNAVVGSAAVPRNSSKDEGLAALQWAKSIWADSFT